jgi:magnesium-transporting ATPase (P-type)
MNDRPQIPWQETPWHAVSAEETLERLGTSLKGLSNAEALVRLKRFGPNALPAAKRHSVWAAFFAQFHNVLIYVLLAASVLTLSIGRYADTLVILAAALINAVIGFIQEGRAERALEAVRKLLALQASVVRNGHRRNIPASEVVPGDIIVLTAGDRVAADMRLVAVKNLRTSEAALTGESLPVDKDIRPIAPAAAVADRTPIAFSGTLAVAGHGVGVVIATGAATEIGRVGRLLEEIEPMTTPLVRQMARFGRWLSAVILAFSVVVLTFGLVVHGLDPQEVVLATVGLFVAAIPEGLPALITVVLALGVQRMAARKALIRRLPAVEALGTATVICSDKTGTLTRNELMVRSAVTARRRYTIGGAGYDPHGGFFRDGVEILAPSDPDLLWLLRAGLLTSESSIHPSAEGWQLAGDPVDGALLVAGLKAGYDQAGESQACPRTDLLPFDSERGFMASLHHDHLGHGFLFVKGAPERLLEMCEQERADGASLPIDRRRWQEAIEALARKGERVIAIAEKRVTATHRVLNLGDVSGRLTMLGLVGLLDAPREEAKAAVAACRGAGITVKMITGDHALTAEAIAEEIGIGRPRPALSGERLAAMRGHELAEAVRKTDVFARVSPELKLALLLALQAQGEIVAMTGDGVNDAPALKRADIGIAMGLSGTEAAKAAAEMVLVDDNFASIAAAVEEGRTVYDNLKKTIMYMLPTNGGEMLAIVVGLVFGVALPITPLQILWVNLITEVTLTLSLAFEPMEARAMMRPPRDPREAIMTGFLIWRVVFVSFLMLAAALGLFLYELDQGGTLAQARTAAVNALVVGEIAYLFNARLLAASSLGRAGLFGSSPALLASGAVIVAQILFTYWPPAQAVFATEPLGLSSWLAILGAGLVLFFAVEGEKFALRRGLAPLPPPAGKRASV